MASGGGRLFGVPLTRPPVFGKPCGRGTAIYSVYLPFLLLWPCHTGMRNARSAVFRHVAMGLAGAGDVFLDLDGALRSVSDRTPGPGRVVKDDRVEGEFGWVTPPR